MVHPRGAAPYSHLLRYVLDGDQTEVGEYELVLSDARQFGDLTFLPEFPVDSVFDDRDVEHLGGRGAVDISAVAEGFESPLLSGDPSDHTRLDGGEVCNDPAAARLWDESSTNQFRESRAYIVIQ